MTALAFHRRVAFRGLDDVVGVFAGRGGPAAGDRGASLRRLLPAGVDAAWLEQVHSATVVDAAPGSNGAADALVTAQRGLALGVVTADCVPVLLADGSRVAAVHAGWRGIVAGVVGATLVHLDAPSTRAWIGPAIGVGAYEVSTEVGMQIAEASAPDVLRDGPRGRPCADLARAVRRQLESAGVTLIDHVDLCTWSARDRLHSYRRDGAGSGRNWSVIWRS